MLPPKKVFHFILLALSSVLFLSFVSETIAGKKQETIFKYFKISDIIGYEAFAEAKHLELVEQKSTAEAKRKKEESIKKISSKSDTLQFMIQQSQLDSTKFYYATGVKDFWFPIFEEWAKLRKSKKLYRILHYGDSQIEMDRITSHIREKLQSRYGGSGPGILPPLQLVPSYTISQTASGNWQRLVSYGASNTRAPHNRYGITGMIFRYNGGNAQVSISPREKKYQYVRNFETVKVITGAYNRSFTVSLQNGNTSFSQMVPSEGKEQLIKWQLDSNKSKVSLNFQSDSVTDILGIAIDGKYGIAMDNIAWRGSSGLTFTSINKASLSQTYKFLNVRMVIMQFGGNSMPYIKDPKAAERYAASFAKQIDYIRSIDTSIKILVIGPADMSTNIDGSMQTPKMLEYCIQKMAEEANKRGAAFWSMYHAMGGKNSMVKWVRRSPAYGAPDYIHFSKIGAEEMSKILYSAIEREYGIYMYHKNMEALKVD